MCSDGVSVRPKNGPKYRIKRGRLALLLAVLTIAVCGMTLLFTLKFTEVLDGWLAETWLNWKLR